MTNFYKDKQHLNWKLLFTTALVSFLLMPIIVGTAILLFDKDREEILKTARNIYYGRLQVKEHLKVQLHKFLNDVNLLFDSNPSSLSVVDLSIAPADLRRIEVITEEIGASKALQNSAKKWFPGTIVNDNNTYSVKARIRGDQASHWLNKKKSWRIKFQKHHLFQGRRSLNLIIPGDKLYEIEHAAYLIAEQLGLLVPDSGFMLVNQNRNNMGLYFWIEEWDQNQFERRQLADGEIIATYDVFLDHDVFKGKLTKSIGRETIEFTPAAYKTFIHKNDEISLLASERWKNFLELLATKNSILINDEIENYLDIDKFAKWLSVIFVFGDTHGEGSNNLKWFFNAITGKFQPIPYDVAVYGMGPAQLDSEFTNAVVHSILLSEKVINKRNESLYDIAFNRNETIINTIKSVSELTDQYIFMGIEGFGTNNLRGLGAATVEGKYFSSENRLNFVRENLSGIKEWITNQRVFISSSQKVQQGSIHIEMEILPQGVAPFVLNSLSLKPVLEFDQGIEDVEFTLTFPSGRKEKINPQNKQMTTDKWRFDFNDLVLRTGRTGNIGDQHISEKWVLTTDVKGVSTQSSALPTSIDITFSNGLTGKVIPSNLVRTNNIATKFNIDTDFLEKEISGVLPGRTEDQMALTHLNLNKEIDTFVNNIQIPVQLDADRIIIPKGHYEIRQNIVVPKDYSLIIEAGTHLMLGPNVSLLSYNAVQMEGNLLEPIVIKRLSPKSAWGIIGVISAKQKSVLKFVKISGGGAGTKNIVNGIYFTGQLNFHYSDVELVNCSITNSEGEDGLNVKKGHVTINDSLFAYNKADAFDGDWVSGKISGSHFLGNGNDGVDISGSKMLIVDTIFFGMGDKAVSIGEQSQVDLLNNRVQNSVYGVVVKDLSRVRMYSTVIQRNQYGVASYRKKPLFGGGTVHIIGGLLLENKNDFLIDQVSSISLYGVGLEQLPKLKKIVLKDQRLGEIAQLYRNDQHDNPIPISVNKLPMGFQIGPSTSAVLIDGSQLPDLSKFPLGLLEPLIGLK